jgi:hypothetical protein
MICICPMDICMRNLQQKAEKGQNTGSESTTKFPQASCFEKPTHSVPEIWGRMYNVQLRVPKVQETGQKIGFPCSQKRRKEISK